MIKEDTIHLAVENNDEKPPKNFYVSVIHDSAAHQEIMIMRGFCFTS